MPHTGRKDPLRRRLDRARRAEKVRRRAWRNRDSIPINEVRIDMLLRESINAFTAEINAHHAQENQKPSPRYTTSEHESLLAFLKRPHNSSIWFFPRVITLDLATLGLLNEILATRPSSGIYKYLTGQGVEPALMKSGLPMWWDTYKRERSIQLAGGEGSGPARANQARLGVPPDHLQGVVPIARGRPGRIAGSADMAQGAVAGASGVSAGIGRSAGVTRRIGADADGNAVEARCGVASAGGGGALVGENVSLVRDELSQSDEEMEEAESEDEVEQDGFSEDEEQVQEAMQSIQRFVREQRAGAYVAGGKTIGRQYARQG